MHLFLSNNVDQTDESSKETLANKAALERIADTIVNYAILWLIKLEFLYYMYMMDIYYRRRDNNIKCT